LPVDVARKLEAATGIRLVATYGATEFTQNVTQAPRDGEPRYGSAGIRNPDTQIRIVHLDAAGAIMRDCRPNEIGCVLVRSPGNTLGYVDGPDDPSVLRPDGWINNGDLGRLDEDGYLWITGRAKDLIIRSGHNIDPAIIEEALYKSPAVFMAAAVGKPDRYAGELPVAYVQLVAGASVTEDDLKALARAHISDPAAVPREIHVVEEMPLTDVRKIAKPALRRQAAQGVFEAELRKALPADVPFSVQVVADDTDGSVAEIKVSGQAAPASGGLGAQISDVMQGYAMRHRVIRT
jgi:fatty-acyl-CoA synthase